MLVKKISPPIHSLWMGSFPLDAAVPCQSLQVYMELTLCVLLGFNPTKLPQHTMHHVDPTIDE